MPDSNSNIKEAMERLKQAEAELLKAVYKKIQNSSAPEEKKKEAEEAAAKAAEEVYEAQTALAAAADNLADAEGVKGGRRKHKARGTKRRRHSGGFMEYLPESLKNLFGLSPNPPPRAAAPVAAPPPGASASFGGKSGKKRKHSRRKY